MCYNWVPGHADIKENDIADDLTKEGAKWSSSLRCNIDLKGIARNGTFGELELRNFDFHN